MTLSNFNSIRKQIEQIDEEIRKDFDVFPRSTNEENFEKINRNYRKQLEQWIKDLDREKARKFASMNEKNDDLFSRKNFQIDRCRQRISQRKFPSITIEIQADF